MKSKNTHLEQRVMELEQLLQYYQDYDALTGLYNKDAFYVQMQRILTQHADIEYQVASLDIEHFKLVNDIFGVQHGDKILCELAAKLRSIQTRDDICVARVTADRFLVLMPVANSDVILHAIEHALDDYILDMDIVIAVGVYVIVDRSISVRLMCDRAGIAANSIKGNYQRHVEWFRDEMRNVLIEEQELLNGVVNSLRNGEFEVYIQPKCNMQTGKICGGEALVRWNHPTKGMIPPKDFISIFEKNGFIKQLDVFVWEETAKWLHDWMRQGNDAIPISVNVSRVDMTNLDIFSIFQSLVKKYELVPSYLELEITESAYSSRNDDIIYIVNEMMKSGFTVLMDDFGCGYSSLNLLKDISIDVLKLDMRFLDSDDKKSKDILESVVHMAKWLNLKIVAEGVESLQQVDFLLGIGVRFAQGFYYYRPMPIKEFAKLIQDKDRVDFDAQNKYQDRMEWLRFKDLIHEDIISEQMLNQILGAVSVYSLYDGEVEILRGNEAYFRLIDVQDNNLTYHHDLRSLMSQEDYQRVLEGMHKAKESRDNGHEVIVQRKRESGNYISVQIRIFFLSETNGTSTYYASLRDVTTYVNALEEIRVSEERFRIAMEASRDTIFELDVKKKIVTYSERSQIAFGLSDHIENAPYGFLEQGSICEGYETAFCNVYEAIYRGEDRAEAIIQANMGNGEKRWNKITLTAIRDKNGKTVRAVGLVQDVTKEKDLEARLKQTEMA